MIRGLREQIADTFMDAQEKDLADNTQIDLLNDQLKDVQKCLNNIMAAIEAGIIGLS